MDKQRINQDLILLQNGDYREATWTYNEFGVPNFLRIFGAFALPEERFNLPDCNLLVPVPSNLYDPNRKGKFHFYKYVYVDERLRIRRPLLRWRRIQRGYSHNVYNLNEEIPPRSGWQWICVMTPTCGVGDSIETFIAQVQTYLNNDA